MKRYGVLTVMGGLMFGLLWGPPCQAQSAGWAGDLFKGTSGSHKISALPGRSAPWAWRMVASDRGLGFNRPMHANVQWLDPDFSAVYAVGGGLDVAISPTAVFSTSVQFLWTKIDGAWRDVSDAHSAASDLTGFNIRAVNLVFGLRARF